MQCDYCDATENVSLISDRKKLEADVRICRDCWYAGVEPWLSELLEDTREDNNALS